MKKLNKIWNDMQDYEKFMKRNKLTLCEFHEVVRICDALYHGVTDTTISESVKKVFDKYGFGTFSKGIGWRIKKNRQPKKYFENCLRSLYGDEFYEAHIKHKKDYRENRL